MFLLMTVVMTGEEKETEVEEKWRGEVSEGCCRIRRKNVSCRSYNHRD